MMRVLKIREDPQFLPCTFVSGGPTHPTPTTRDVAG